MKHNTLLHIVSLKMDSQTSSQKTHEESSTTTPAKIVTHASDSRNCERVMLITAALFMRMMARDQPNHVKYYSADLKQILFQEPF